MKKYIAWPGRARLQSIRMKTKDLLEHRAQLNAKLEAVELEKAQLARKLKAIDVLLEGIELPKQAGSMAPLASPSTTAKATTAKENRAGKPHNYKVPAHAVRTSPRSSLIDAVCEVARKQKGSFDSGQLLKALQSDYPEFNLTETKHISSPLSDLVKRGALIIERIRNGKKPNIYRAVLNQ